MAACFRIILSKHIEGLDDTIDGASLASETANLDWLAKECGVKRLADFCGPKMFSAEEGLRVIQFYYREIAAYVDVSKRYGPLLCDLRNCERILFIASQHDVRWQFRLEDKNAT
jgi:hypothetical protein